MQPLYRVGVTYSPNVVIAMNLITFKQIKFDSAQMELPFVIYLSFNQTPSIGEQQFA